jgi:uncharacterized lipoprotein YajG
MKNISILAMLLAFFALAGCQSVALSQVSEHAPERPINSPEQAERLLREHSP